MSSEAAQEAGGGAMSTRDELEQTITDVMESFVEREPTVHDISAAVIAEGWRKKPSREELANVLGLQAALDWVDGETVGQFGLRLADAVLALMDRGQ